MTQELVNINFEEVYKYSSEGLELFPAQPYVYFMNGRALINQKKYNKAINVLVNGLDFLIDDTKLEKEFYQELIVCYNAIDDEKSAEKYQQKLKKLNG